VGVQGHSDAGANRFPEAGISPKEISEEFEVTLDEIEAGAPLRKPESGSAATRARL